MSWPTPTTPTILLLLSLRLLAALQRLVRMLPSAANASTPSPNGGAAAEVQGKYEASEARAAEAGRRASQVESQVEMRAMSIYERMQRAAAAPALAPPAPTPPLADEQEI
jgi:hypothetical protein